jgi:glycosyltransferase involved in cell wall biosynthesis
MSQIARIEQNRSNGHGHIASVLPGPWPQVVAIVPAYNEERFIGSVVLKTKQYVDTVIVIDDGSSDATTEIAEAAGAIVVRHKRNQGKGHALNTGFQRARELAPQATVLMDGDGQHLAEEIPGLLAPILADEADIVVGSRYMHKECGVPRHRVLGHWAFTSMINLLSGVSLSDSQNGFRAFSAKALDEVSFSSDGFSVESEMQFLARDHRLRVAEAPVTALYPDAPKRSVIAHGLMVLNGLLRVIGQYRPLIFFGGPGVFLLLCGVSWGAWVVIYRRKHGLAAGYAMISVLLSIIGVVGLSTGITLHSIRGLLLDLMRRDKDRDRM